MDDRIKQAKAILAEANKDLRHSYLDADIEWLTRNSPTDELAKAALVVKLLGDSEQATKNHDERG